MPHSCRRSECSRVQALTELRRALVRVDEEIRKLELRVSAAGDELRTIIAGYHWFGDWGRDTMISLPGLAIETGRADIAKSILKSFADVVDGGMMAH